MGCEKNNKYIGDIKCALIINKTPELNRQAINEINKCTPNIYFEYTPDLEKLVLSLSKDGSEKIKRQRDCNKLGYLYQKIADSWSELFDERKSTKGHNNLNKMYSKELVAILKTSPENEKYCSTFKVSFVIDNYVKDRDGRKCFENPPALFRTEYCLNNNKKHK